MAEVRIANKGLGIFLGYKLLVFGLAWVGIAVFAKIWPASPSHFISLLFQWDAKHVLRVASQGYLAGEPSIQVFPFFPVLIRLLHLIIRNWEWSAVLATQVCSYFAFHYFYRLARLELNENKATVALVLFALFPTAYFLTAPYTEAAYCALTFAAIYYFRTQRIELAALFGFFAATSRITGLLIAGAIVLSAKKPSWRELKPRLAVAAAIGAGLAAYLGLNRYLYGDWFHFMAEQAKYWGVHTAWPFKGAVEAITAWWVRTPDQRMSIVVLELGFTAVAIGATVIAWQKRKIFDFAYMGLNLLLLVSLDFWLSRPRYVLPLYPLFLLAAPWFAASPIRLGLYALGSAGLFGIYWATYLNAQWAF